MVGGAASTVCTTLPEEPSKGVPGLGSKMARIVCPPTDSALVLIEADPDATGAAPSGVMRFDSSKKPTSPSTVAEVGDHLGGERHRLTERGRVR